MVLGKIFSPKTINIALESSDKDEVFEELIETFVSANPSVDRKQVLDAIKDRESKMTTGIMHGVAVPHGRTSAVKGVHGIIGISKKGIDYDSLDKAPVNVLFLIVSAPNCLELHLRVLKRLAEILKDPTFIESLLSQTSPSAVYDVVCKFEDVLTSSV